MKTGLILVDIQNDYFPGGEMELTGMDAAAVNVGVDVVCVRTVDLQRAIVLQARVSPDGVCSVEYHVSIFNIQVVRRYIAIHLQ